MQLDVRPDIFQLRQGKGRCAAVDSLFGDPFLIRRKHLSFRILNLDYIAVPGPAVTDRSLKFNATLRFASRIIIQQCGLNLRLIALVEKGKIHLHLLLFRPGIRLHLQGEVTLADINPILGAGKFYGISFVIQYIRSGLIQLICPELNLDIAILRPIGCGNPHCHGIVLF